MAFLFITFFIFSGELAKGSQHDLEKVLDIYSKRTLHIKIEKSFKIPVTNKVSKEKGSFHIQNQKFRYLMQGSPSRLMVFDGQKVWYQPDTEQNLIFKFNNHPQFELLRALFDKKKFFQLFKLVKTVGKKQDRIFYLKTNKELAQISELQLHAGRYIKSLKLIWPDQDMYQNYKFSNPWFKKSFAQSLFFIDPKKFEVISEN